MVAVRLWGISARGREGWVRAALPGQRRVKSKAEPKQRTLLEIEPWLALSQQLFAHRGLQALLQVRYQLFVRRVDFSVRERPLPVSVREGIGHTLLP